MARGALSAVLATLGFASQTGAQSCPFEVSQIFQWDGPYDYTNRGFLIADVNGDGRDDLIVTRAEPGRAEASYTLASETGYGSFQQIFQWDGPYDFTNRGFLIADVDGDGRDDLIVTRAEPGRAEASYTLASETGYGSFQQIFQWDGPYDFTNRGFLIADVDGDGRDDLIVTRAEPGRAEASYILASETGYGSFQQIFQWDGPYDFTNRGFLIADVNGDGRDDLIVTRAEPGRAEASYTLASATGFGSFQQIFQWDGPYDYTSRGFLIADVNGDGRDDLIVTRAELGRAEASYTLASETGFGSFQQIFQWNGPYDFTNRGFLIADVDENGRGDLIVTRAEPGRAEASYTLASETGHGSFQQIFQWDGPYDFTNRGFLIADVDGNGRDDLIVTRAEPGRAEAHAMRGCGGVTPFCFGDSSGMACPCGNTGNTGNGCEHSFLLGGANLSSTGVADVSTDTLRLVATNLPPATTALFFQGDAIIPGGAASFGDGLRCAAGIVVRLGIRPVVDGTVEFGSGVAGCPPINAAGLVPSGGGTRYYQVWYRNNVAFCDSAAFNLSNGLIATWSP